MIILCHKAVAIKWLKLCSNPAIPFVSAARGMIVMADEFAAVLEMLTDTLSDGRTPSEMALIVSGFLYCYENFVINRIK